MKAGEWIAGLFEKVRGKRQRPFCSCVVVAAGEAARFGGDKMWMELRGLPLIARTLTAIELCPCIDEIILVTRGSEIVDMAKLCREYGIDKATKIIAGGETRTESVLAGLSEVSSEAGLAAIHDGARPFVTADIVEAAVLAAAEHLAAAPAVPLKDTIKRVNAYGEAEETPPRAEHVAVQTPQVFETDLIKAALTNARDKGLVLTDDCSAVEALGVRPVMTPGSEENIKITTPLDIRLAEAILDFREP